MKPFLIALVTQMAMVIFGLVILIFTILSGHAQFVVQVLMAAVVVIESVTLTAWYSWARQGRLYLVTGKDKR